MRLAVLAFVAAGCNQIVGIGDVHTGSGAPGTPDGPQDQLHGMSQITWLHPSDAPTTSSEDLSGYTIRALVRDDTAAGGFRSIAGTGGDGTFSVPVTVDGTADVYLELTRPGTPTHAIYKVDRNAVDAGYPTLGHAGPAITAKTPVAIQVTGMTPWGGVPDAFHLMSYGAGVDGSSVLGFSGNPASGATSTTTSSYDWSFATVADPGGAPPRALGADDELWVAHVHGADLTLPAPDTAQLGTIADALEIPSLAMTDGTPATARGAMHALTADHAQAFALDLGQFFAARPGVTTQVASCSRYESPGASQGLALGVPVWSLSLDLASTVPVESLKSLAYADPFPPSWAAVIQCDVWEQVHLTIPGFGMAGFAVHDLVTVPGGADVTVQPTLTPPSGATFGGIAFEAGGTVTSDGKPITIAWSATPWATQYHLDVRRIVPTGTPPIVVAAAIDTTDTHVDLPLDLITPGSSYVISLWSVKATEGLPAGQLRETGAYTERAMMISQPFSVQ
jgi:hypothetical protein